MNTASGTRQIRVMVVDDHAVVRSGLATFLMVYDDLQLVGEAANGTQAVRLCGELLPDVVLMDLSMPEMDGIEATRAIKQRYPDVMVVALTGSGEEHNVHAVLQAGAIGYLLKSTSSDQLAVAIRRACAGQPTLAPEASHALVRSVTHPHPTGSNLTPREREVLKLLVKGLNNPQIAEALGLSRSTARFHVSSILSKLNVTGRVEAVAIAVEYHLVR